MRSYISIITLLTLPSLVFSAPAPKPGSNDLTPAPVTGLGPNEGDFISEGDEALISEIEASPVQADSFAPKASPNPKTAIEKLPPSQTARSQPAPNKPNVTSSAGASAADDLPLEAPVETVPDETTADATPPETLPEIDPASNTEESAPLTTEGLVEENNTPSETIAEEEPAELEETEREERLTSLSRRRLRRGEKPIYYRDKPTTAFKLQGSGQALGDPIIKNNGDEFDVRHFGFGLAWMPKFLQYIGAVSFGGSFNVYPILPLGGITRGAFDVISFGGSVEYQAQFWDGQPIVPFIGYEWQQFRYSLRDGAVVDKGWTLASGMTSGVHFLLNWIEPDGAFEAFKNTGIRRSYLTAEWKQLQTDYNLLDSVDHAVFIGLRVEY